MIPEYDRDDRLDRAVAWIILAPASAFLVLGLVIAGGTILRLW